MCGNRNATNWSRARFGLLHAAGERFFDEYTGRKETNEKTRLPRLGLA